MNEGKLTHPAVKSVEVDTSQGEDVVITFADDVTRDQYFPLATALAKLDRDHITNVYGPQDDDRKIVVEVFGTDGETIRAKVCELLDIPVPQPTLW